MVSSADSVMNQIMDNIKKRRSKRYFSGEKIPEEKINEIIEAGRYAPSALNKQPWKFIVLTNSGKIKDLSGIVKDAYRRISRFLPLLKVLKPMLRDPQVAAAINKTLSGGEDSVFYSAPLLILVVADKKDPYAERDCAMASQNMMLYAHSVGIRSCYIGRADILMMSGRARDMIGLPSGCAIKSAVVFGYSPEGDKDMPVPRRKKDNIINWVR